MTTLMPCGCGGTPILSEGRHTSGVYCPECAIQGPVEAHPEQAISKWNHAMSGKREAAAALGKWIRHEHSCELAQRIAQDHGHFVDCRCGLSAALEALNG